MDDIDICINLELMPEQLDLLIEAVQYYRQEKDHDTDTAEELDDLLEELESAGEEAEEAGV